MVTFAVPQYHDVGHAILGFLLDRAELSRVYIDGRHELRIVLVQEDAQLLRELGVFETGSDDEIEPEFEAQDDCNDSEDDVRNDFENMLSELQLKLEESLARAKRVA